MKLCVTKGKKEMNELLEATGRLNKVRMDIEELKRAEKFIEADILKLAHNQLAEQFNKADYGTGTATLTVGHFKMKVVISKKVSYDQDGLKAVCEQLAANGEDIGEYVKTKYDVAESAYKAWPSSLQKLFEPYRTVEASKPTIKIEV